MERDYNRSERSVLFAEGRVSPRAAGGRESGAMRNPGLDRLNALPAEQARAELVACCSAERWVSDVGSGRPYPSVDDLLASSDASVAGLTQADLEQALAG